MGRLAENSLRIEFASDAVSKVLNSDTVPLKIHLPIIIIVIIRAISITIHHCHNDDDGNLVAGED